MSLILASRPNPLSGSPLDRAAHLREQEGWLEEQLANPASLFLPVWRSKNLVRRTDSGAEAVMLTGGAAAALRMAGGAPANHSWAFLGLRDGVALFCIDLSGAEDPLPLLPPEIGAFEELRTASDVLPADDASIMAHARALLHWRSRHNHCGFCGGDCVPKSAGHVMHCTECGSGGRTRLASARAPSADACAAIKAMRSSTCKKWKKCSGGYIWAICMGIHFN